MASGGRRMISSSIYIMLYNPPYGFDLELGVTSFKKHSLILLSLCSSVAP